MIHSIAQARRHFSDLVKRAAYRGETVTVGTRGKPEAALISVEELRRLRAMELEHDARLIKEAVRQSKGAVGIEELLRAWRGGTVSKPALASKAAPRKAAVRRITRKGRS